MASRFEPFVALRYLRSKRKEVFISIITVISVLGVAVSVMVLDIVLAVMTGFEAELQSKLIDANAHLIFREIGGDMEDWEELVSVIEKDPDVVTVVPFTFSQAMISTKGGARGVIIRGVPNRGDARGKLARLLPSERETQRLFTPATTPVERPDGTIDEVVLPPLIVGAAFRDQFGVKEGSTVTVLTPQVTSSPQGLIPRLKRFLVVGTYASGLIEYEKGLAYTSLADAQRFFGLGSKVTGIEVDVTDLMRARKIGERIMRSLGPRAAGIVMTDWTEPNKPLWDAIRLEKRVYFIVLLLLVLVASFSIVSTLVMVVMEKSRDIAILKSMGAADSTVRNIFMLQGSIIGAAGIVLGTILGIAGCFALRRYGFKLDESVFSLKEVPVHMIPANFVTVAVAAFVITVIAGVYPARRAAKLRPADVLRYE